MIPTVAKVRVCPDHVIVYLPHPLFFVCEQQDRWNIDTMRGRSRAGVFWFNFPNDANLSLELPKSGKQPEPSSSSLSYNGYAWTHCAQRPAAAVGHEEQPHIVHLSVALAI
jgi:hypothetical protein